MKIKAKVRQCVLDCLMNEEQYEGGNKQNKKLEEEIYVFHYFTVSREYFLLVGYIRKFTSSYRWGNLLIFILGYYYTCIFMPCTCVGNGPVVHFCFLLHALLYTHTHTHTHTETYTHSHTQEYLNNF